MKRSALKRRAKVRLPFDELAARRRWHDLVIAHGCAMCRVWPPTVDVSQEFAVRRVQAHHIIAKSRLKQEGLHAHLYDLRDGVCLCEYHHARHHNYQQRVPRDLVAHAEPFAAEHGLMSLLEREYPA